MIPIFVLQDKNGKSVLFFYSFERYNCLPCRQTTEGRIHSEQSYQQQWVHRLVTYVVFIICDIKGVS